MKEVIGWPLTIIPEVDLRTLKKPNIWDTSQLNLSIYPEWDLRGAKSPEIWNKINLFKTAAEQMLVRVTEDWKKTQWVWQDLASGWNIVTNQPLILNPDVTIQQNVTAGTSAEQILSDKLKIEQLQNEWLFLSDQNHNVDLKNILNSWIFDIKEYTFWSNVFRVVPKSLIIAPDDSQLFFLFGAFFNWHLSSWWRLPTKEDYERIIEIVWDDPTDWQRIFGIEKANFLFDANNWFFSDFWIPKENVLNIFWCVPDSLKLDDKYTTNNSVLFIPTPESWLKVEIFNQADSRSAFTVRLIEDKKN